MTEQHQRLEELHARLDIVFRSMPGEEDPMPHVKRQVSSARTAVMRAMLHLAKATEILAEHLAGSHASSLADEMCQSLAAFTPNW